MSNVEVDNKSPNKKNKMHIIPGDTSGCIKLFLLVIYLLSKLHMCIYRLAYEEVMAKGSNRSARAK